MFCETNLGHILDELMGPMKAGFLFKTFVIIIEPKCILYILQREAKENIFKDYFLFFCLYNEDSFEMLKI